MGKKHSIINRCYRIKCVDCSHFRKYNKMVEPRPVPDGRCDRDDRYWSRSYFHLYKKIFALKNDPLGQLPIEEFRLKLRHQPSDALVVKEKKESVNADKLAFKEGANPSGVYNITG